MTLIKFHQKNHQKKKWNEMVDEIVQNKEFQKKKEDYLDKP